MSEIPFKLTHEVWAQLDAEYGVKFGALQDHERPWISAEFFPACVGYTTTPKPMFIYSMVKLIPLLQETYPRNTKEELVKCIEIYIQHGFFDKRNTGNAAIIMDDRATDDGYVYWTQGDPTPSTMPKGCETYNPTPREWLPTDKPPREWYDLERRWPKSQPVAKPVPKVEPVKPIIPAIPDGWFKVKEGDSVKGDQHVERHVDVLRWAPVEYSIGTPVEKYRYGIIRKSPEPVKRGTVTKDVPQGWYTVQGGKTRKRDMCWNSFYKDWRPLVEAIVGNPVITFEHVIRKMAKPKAEAKPGPAKRKTVSKLAIPKGWELVTKGRSKLGDMFLHSKGNRWVEVQISVGNLAKGYTKLIRRIKAKPGVKPDTQDYHTLPNGTVLVTKKSESCDKCYWWNQDPHRCSRATDLRSVCPCRDTQRKDSRGVIWVKK